MTQETGRLTVDAVIATRNRTDALALSIPLLLAQSRPPERLIVIDSSDDHGPIAELVARATAGWSGHVVVEHSAPGLPHQRNRGLRHVKAPVVLFPDDDSLFHSGALEAIMAVYDRDRDGQVAGVAAREALEPPEGGLPQDVWRPSQVHRRAALLAPLRYRLDRRLEASNPFLTFGALLKRETPDWLTALNAVPIEYMTGFRMSFRTDIIRSIGFDETLQGHALGEDIDASFGALRHGMLVGARDAGIYHHRFPGGRGDGYRQGVVSVLNRTYIIRKHLDSNNFSSSTRRRILAHLSQYFRLRLLSLLPGLARATGRAQLRGMRRAFPFAARLRRAGTQDLVAEYRAAMKALEL